jgi:hypothetical protein
MSELMIGKTATGLRLPVLVDTTGQLLVSGGGGGGSTDMTTANAQLTAINANTDQLESKADTSNGILTTQAADTALIKANQTNGTQSTKIVNGANTLAVDSSGALTINNQTSSTYTYNASGIISQNTILIGPITCSQFKEFAVEVSSLGTSGQIAPELSNDNTNWYSVYFTNGNSVYSGNASSTGIFNISTNGAFYFRIRLTVATTAGTTNLVAVAFQQPIPKSIQSVNIAASSIGNLATTAIPTTANYSGFSTYHSLVSAASTNATLVSSGAHTIGTLILTNNSASWAYFKLCNTATAPTVGTTTAVINIGVAPNSTLDCSSSFAGLRLATGLAYYVSAGTSLTDSTALAAAGTFLVNMTYV